MYIYISNDDDVADIARSQGCFAYTIVYLAHRSPCQNTYTLFIVYVVNDDQHSSAQIFLDRLTLYLKFWIFVDQC